MRAFNLMKSRATNVLFPQSIIISLRDVEILRLLDLTPVYAHERRRQATALVELVRVCESAAPVVGDRPRAVTLRAPPKSRQQWQVCDSKAGHTKVSQ